ncbi:FtsK/SpoIIIE domain-containing protein [Actinoplanes sp. TFC3]|uniref:FtsK/SpoIIIE domain-containing protein n=1 Tax=Actinoplanes sp. TFC3 TaxID=1710355 RepID=UPI00083520B2|nr:FtsK/SpoIIIE domain-containing protein [Actinoplanes sp. TFC3]
MSTIARDPLGTDGVPVWPGMSMFDPMFIGIDEFGEHVMLDIPGHNLLMAGEPGAGKSGLINTITSTAALCDKTRLVAMDAKWVELGPWAPICDAFIGDDLDQAIRVLRRLLTVAHNRYQWLLANRRRKVTATDDLSAILTVIDELAMYSTVLGTKEQREEYLTLLRGLVALGRAAAMPVVAASQRTSWDIIPASLRDLFGYRCAFRCTTTGSSDVILGSGWAEQGYTASDIDPENRGAAWLLAEGSTPKRIKAAYLSDQQIYGIADYAAWLRQPTRNLSPTDWEMAA